MKKITPMLMLLAIATTMLVGCQSGPEGNAAAQPAPSNTGTAKIDEQSKHIEPK